MGSQSQGLKSNTLVMKSTITELILSALRLKNFLPNEEDVDQKIDFCQHITTVEVDSKRVLSREGSDDSLRSIR